MSVVAPGAAEVVRILPTSAAQRSARTAAAASPVAWQRGVVTALVGIDFAAAAVGAGSGYLAIDRTNWLDVATACLLPLGWVAVATANRAYELRLAGIGAALFTRTLRTFVQLCIALTFVAFFSGDALSRPFAVIALPAALALSCAARFGLHLRLRSRRAAGHALTPVLALGSVDSILRLAESVNRDPASGWRVDAACLHSSETRVVRAVRRLSEHGIRVVGDIAHVRYAAVESGAQGVLVQAGDFAPSELRRVAWELEGTGTELLVSTGLAEVCAPRLHVQSVGGAPILRVEQPHFTGFRRWVKCVFDRVAAAIAIIVLAPLLVSIAILVRCTSRGPALYRASRIGRDGKEFKMLKFRSMCIGADTRVAELADRNESGGGPLFKIHDDPRVTPLGRVLRRFSLDELPQLFNIVGGSMSLVGPRPPLPSEVAQYDEDTKRRLLVRPGLTGLWQVSGRSDLSWEESVRLDLHYVENWSLALDMVVLFRTVRVVVRATGAY